MTKKYKNKLPSEIKQELLVRLGKGRPDSAFYILHAFLNSRKNKRDMYFLRLWEIYLMLYRIFDDIIDDGKSNLIPHFFDLSVLAQELLLETLLKSKEQKKFLYQLREMHIHMALDMHRRTNIKHYLNPRVNKTTYMKSWGIVAIIDAYLIDKIKNYNSTHQKDFHSFMKHLLIGRQLSDDASDWYDDVMKYTETKNIPATYYDQFENRIAFTYAEKITRNLERALSLTKTLRQKYVIKDEVLMNRIIKRIYLPAKKILTIKKPTTTIPNG